MIDIKDLRVGNCYLLSGHFYQLDEKGLENIFIFKHLERLSPIPLTSEILESAGFVSSGKIISNPYCSFHELSEGLYIPYFGMPINSWQLTKIKPFQYLHQLQNIIYDLIGRELTINLTHSLSHSS